MRNPNIGDILDEAIVLHASVSQTLLAEFPEAHGVTFFPKSDPPKALPTLDVPANYADAYGDAKFEARSEELLARIADRMSALQERGRKALDVGERFFIKATRNDVDTGKRVLAMQNIIGGFSDGTGSLCIRREMTSMNHKFMTLSPLEVMVTAIVEDDSHKSKIEAAAAEGFSDVIEYLHANGLLLNHRFKGRSLAATMAWTRHIADLNPKATLSFDDPVCRVFAYSDYKESHFFWPSDLPQEPDDTITVKKTLFDPVRGVAHAVAEAPPSP